MMPNFGNTCKFVEDVPTSFWLQRTVRMMGTELQAHKDLWYAKLDQNMGAHAPEQHNF